MLQLALLIVLGSTAHIHVVTSIRFRSWGVRWTNTENTVWFKNANNPAISVNSCCEPGSASLNFPGSHSVVSNTDTWIWTTGDDALLVNYFNMEYDGGFTRRYGRDSRQGWCLSTDHFWDAYEFNWDNYEGLGSTNVVPAGSCYSLLELNSDNKVYYYYDQSWRPGRRRALAEEAGIPSVDDVKACEDDPNTDTDQDCGPMVDQIINYEVQHWKKMEANQEDLEALQKAQMQQRAVMAELSAGSRASTSNVQSAADPVTFDDCVVYAFAALGVAALVAGAYKIFQKSSSSEHVPINQSAADEL